MTRPPSPIRLTGHHLSFMALKAQSALQAPRAIRVNPVRKARKARLDQEVRKESKASKDRRDRKAHQAPREIKASRVRGCLSMVCFRWDSSLSSIVASLLFR